VGEEITGLEDELGPVFISAGEVLSDPQVKLSHAFFINKVNDSKPGHVPPGKGCTKKLSIVSKEIDNRILFI
jgi:hypothetical protein